MPNLHQVVVRMVVRPDLLIDPSQKVIMKRDGERLCPMSRNSNNLLLQPQLLRHNPRLIYLDLIPLWPHLPMPILQIIMIIGMHLVERHRIKAVVLLMLILVV